MDNGMESMLDTYLYETNSLLDQLDEMLVNDEKAGDFSSDDVNEIFRIMHTIKGSSAMMEFHSLSTIAHHIEDLFFFIRDKGIDALDPQHKKELFNLMFRSEDCLPEKSISFSKKSAARLGQQIPLPKTALQRMRQIRPPSVRSPLTAPFRMTRGLPASFIFI